MVSVFDGGYSVLLKPEILWPLIGVFPLTYLMTYLFENIRWLVGWPTLVFPALLSITIFCFSLNLTPFTGITIYPLIATTYAFYGTALLICLAMNSPLTLLSLVLAPLPAIAFGINGAGIQVGALAFLMTLHLPWVPSIAGLFWSFFAAMTAILFASIGPSIGDLGVALGFEKFQVLYSIASILIGTALGLIGTYLHRPHLWTNRWFFRPEDRLGHATANLLRHRNGIAGISCPFSGSWTVYQGFSGPWTHRGNFQYALDFVQKDSKGLSHRGNSHNLKDYYAFGQEVVAPSDGTIVACYDGYGDQQIGFVDNEHRWGNFLIILDAYGRSFVIAHLKQNSIKVRLHDPVCQGQLIAQCGNSGYSPEPHIHIQVQASTYLGQPTLPFLLLNYVINEPVKDSEVNEKSGTSWFYHGIPQEGDCISSPKININLSRCLSFTIGESFKFSCLDSMVQQEFTITNNLDEHRSLMYLTDGQARLYHFRQHGQLILFDYRGPNQHPLKDLLIAAPRIPLAYHPHLEFAESFYGIASHGFGRQALNPLKAIRFNTWSPSHVDSCPIKFVFDGNALRLSSNNQWLGVETFCQFDPWEGLTQFGVGDRTYGVLSLKRVLPAYNKDFNSHPNQSRVLVKG